MSPTRPSPCPLCEATFDDQDDLLVHLLVTHRKSEIVRALSETETLVIA